MGYVYDKWLTALVLSSILLQLAALPVFFWGRAESKNVFQ